MVIKAATHDELQLEAAVPTNPSRCEITIKIRVQGSLFSHVIPFPRRETRILKCREVLLLVNFEIHHNAQRILGRMVTLDEQQRRGKIQNRFTAITHFT
jgi:hypothetical protein